jgi:hypothetical protein
MKDEGGFDSVENAGKGASRPPLAAATIHHQRNRYLTDVEAK